MSGLGALPLAEIPVEDEEEALRYAPEPVEEEEPPQPTAEERAAAASRAAMEAEARRSGWVPEDVYRGPPGMWRDAETYLQRGKEILPIVRKELRTTQAKLDTITGEMAALKAKQDADARTIAELRQQNTRAEQQGHDRAIAELKAQQRAAAESGNLAEYDEIGEQISEAEEQRMAAAATPPPPAPAPAPAPAAGAPLAPEVQEFIDANPWFMTDPVLHNAVRAAHADLNQRAPGLSLADNLQQARQKAMEQYPEKFGLPPARQQQRRPGANTVINGNAGAGGPQPQPDGTPKTFAAIADPAERQAVQNEYRRAKQNMPELTESAFVRVYFEPGADVLDIMREERAMPAVKRRTA